jgi:hypothetical protein
MGHRVGGARYKLRRSQCDKVLGPRQFCGRLDAFGAEGRSRSHGASMGGLMRWCILPSGVGSSGSPQVPFGYQPPVCLAAEL